jgi:hypothetical protein
MYKLRISSILLKMCYFTFFEKTCYLKKIYKFDRLYQQTIVIGLIRNIFNLIIKTNV